MTPLSGEVRTSASAARVDAVIVSDVHLSSAHPATTDAFLRFVAASVAGRADRLYVIGDLFEYWAGDDDLDDPEDPLARQVADVLSALATSGTDVGFIPGNRDFLIGDAFGRAAGVRLLPDPYPVQVAGVDLLLSHGDALCTDDVDYQCFRAMVREPAWQESFLARPLAERRAVVANARARSEAAKQGKDAAIMDVNDDAVQALLAAYPGRVLVHGHTHRPAHHIHAVGREPRDRWVLPDWDAEATPPRGGGLALQDGHLVPID